MKMTSPGTTVQTWLDRETDGKGEVQVEEDKNESDGDRNESIAVTWLGPD